MDRWLEPPVSDPHVPASLLKLWYRELAEPMVPADVYQRCLDVAEQPREAVDVLERLPMLNRLVLTYLIRFLQVNFIDMFFVFFCRKFNIIFFRSS